MEVKINDEWHKVATISYWGDKIHDVGTHKVQDIKLNGKQLFGNSEQVIVQEQLWQNERRYLLTLDGASVQLATYPSPQGVQKITACIFQLWTNEDKRRQGKARKLLETAERIAKQYGHKEVHIYASLSEIPMSIFQWLDRCGYKEVSHSDGLLMKKEL
jgi:GNAT superfamily N-acetyltransferase